MKINIVQRKDLKARKEHVCSFCDQPIKKGQNYIRLACSNEATEMWTWKVHNQCADIVNELIKVGYLDVEDINCEEFFDACYEYCHNYICPSCEQFDNNIKECSIKDKDFCLDKIENELKK